MALEVIKINCSTSNIESDNKHHILFLVFLFCLWAVIFHHCEIMLFPTSVLVYLHIIPFNGVYSNEQRYIDLLVYVTWNQPEHYDVPFSNNYISYMQRDEVKLHWASCESQIYAGCLTRHKGRNIQKVICCRYPSELTPCVTKQTCCFTSHNSFQKYQLS